MIRNPSLSGPSVSTVSHTPSPDTLSPKPQTPSVKSEEAPSERPIHHSKGPSAALVKRLVAQQQKPLQEASTSAASTTANVDDIMPEALADDLREEYRATGMSPKEFVASLVKQAKEVCPDAAEAVIDAALAGIVEALEEMAKPEVKETKEDIKEEVRTGTKIATSASSAIVRPPEPVVTIDEIRLQKASSDSESDALALQLRRPPSAISLGRPHLNTVEEKIYEHLVKTYLNPILSKNPEDPQAAGFMEKAKKQLEDAAKAFADAGCKSPREVNKLLNDMLASYRKMHTGFAASGEVGYSATMLTFVYGIAPKLPSDLSVAKFGALIGLIAGYGIMVASEATGAVRDNHVPKLKPTGIPALDAELPNVLQVALTAGAVGMGYSMTKNSPRIFAPTLMGKDPSRHKVGTTDTVIDVVGSPFSAAATAYTLHGMQHENMKRMLPFQENLPELLTKFKEPTTLKSAVATVKADAKTFGKALLTTNLSPTTWAMIGYITAMVVALLEAKSEVTKHQPKNPQLNATHMTRAEGAELGAVSTVMMGLLSLLAPVMAVGFQYIESSVKGRVSQWVNSPDEDTDSALGSISQSVKRQLPERVHEWAQRPDASESHLPDMVGRWTSRPEKASRSTEDVGEQDTAVLRASSHDAVGFDRSRAAGLVQRPRSAHLREPSP